VVADFLNKNIGTLQNPQGVKIFIIKEYIKKAPEGKHTSG